MPITKKTAGCIDLRFTEPTNIWPQKMNYIMLFPT